MRRTGGYIWYVLCFLEGSSSGCWYCLKALEMASPLQTSVAESIRSSVSTFISSAIASDAPNVHIATFCNNHIWRSVNVRHKAHLEMIADTMKAAAQESIDARTLLIRVLIKLLIRSIQPHCIDASLEIAVIFLQTLYSVLTNPTVLPPTLLQHITLPFIKTEMQETMACSPVIAYHRLYMTLVCIRLLFNASPSLITASALCDIWSHVAAVDRKHSPPTCSDPSIGRVPLIERVKTNITNAMYFADEGKVSKVAKLFRLEGCNGVSVIAADNSPAPQPQGIGKHWLQSDHVLWCQGRSIFGSGAVYVYQWLSCDARVCSHLSHLLIHNPALLLDMSIPTLHAKKRKREGALSSSMSRQLLLSLIVLFSSSCLDTYCETVADMVTGGLIKLETEDARNSTLLMAALVSHCDVGVEVFDKVVCALANAILDADVHSTTGLQTIASAFAYILIHRYEVILSTPRLFNQVLLIYDTETSISMTSWCEELCDMYVHVFVLPLFNVSTVRKAQEYHGASNDVLAVLDVCALVQKCDDIYDVLSRQLFEWRSTSLPNIHKRFAPTHRREAYISKLRAMLPSSYESSTVSSIAPYMSSDICSYILQFCNFRRVCRFACVSKAFAQATRNQHLWREIYSAKWKNIEFAEKVSVTKKQTRCHCFNDKKNRKPCSDAFTDHNWSFLFQVTLS